MSIDMSSLTKALQNVVSTGYNLVSYDEQKKAAIDAFNTQQRLLENGAFIPQDQILKDPSKSGGKIKRKSYKRRVSNKNKRMKKRKSKKHR